MQPSKVFTVSELTKAIKHIIEDGFGGVRLQGEISNFKHHSSGHMYFTLKDEFSQIQAVLWRARAQNLYFTPQDGMKVLVRGNITVYEVRGVYQIDVVHLEPMGAGELQLAFERLKQKLATEGLFEVSRKKPLPRYPERIGVVTSPTGAALQDMLNILNRRCPAIEVVLYPVKVQGAEAAKEIVQAIEDFNEYAMIDVIILARGGGSLEDLWAFNEEIVARAIHHSNIPIMSAIGHEIDFTIADFVADIRAPTPSAAAELVTPTTAEMVEFVQNFYYNSKQSITETLSLQMERITALLRSYSFNRPFDIIRQHSQQLDELKRILGQSVGHRCAIMKQAHLSLSKRMASLNPESVLQRGYTIIYRDEQIIDHSLDLQPEDNVMIRFKDRRVPATVQKS
jgi:exodeoxyribonuclease VII large subunit